MVSSRMPVCRERNDSRGVSAVRRSSSLVLARKSRRRGKNKSGVAANANLANGIILVSTFNHPYSASTHTAAAVYAQ